MSNNYKGYSPASLPLVGTALTRLPTISRQSSYPLGDIPINVPSCNAWALLKLGTTPTILQGVGISSITRQGTGQYGISFSNPSQYASGSYVTLFTTQKTETDVAGSYSTVTGKCSGSTASGVSSGYQFFYTTYSSAGVPAPSDSADTVNVAIFSFSTDSTLQNKGLTAQYSIVPGASAFGVTYTNVSSPFPGKIIGGISGATLSVSEIIRGSTLAVGNTLSGSFTSYCVGSISGTTLNLYYVNGLIQIGATVSGVNVSTSITAYKTGTGGAGTYTINPGQTAGENSVFYAIKGFTGAIIGIGGTYGTGTGGTGTYGVTSSGKVPSGSSIFIHTASPQIYSYGVSYSSSLPNYFTKRTAVAYGTIVIPPRYGATIPACYLENYYNVGKVIGSSASVFDVLFGNENENIPLKNTNYCVIASTEKETSSSATELINTTPNKNEFCLVQMRAGALSANKTVNQFRLETKRQSPTTALMGVSSGYYANNNRYEKIHFMVFGGRDSYDTN